MTKKARKVEKKKKTTKKSGKNKPEKIVLREINDSIENGKWKTEN